MEIFTCLVKSSAAVDAVAEIDGGSGRVAANAREPSRRETGKADKAAMKLRRDIIVILFKRVQAGKLLALA
jgi:hypothetical protein